MRLEDLALKRVNLTNALVSKFAPNPQIDAHHSLASLKLAYHASLRDTREELLCFLTTSDARFPVGVPYGDRTSQGSPGAFIEEVKTVSCVAAH